MRDIICLHAPGPSACSSYSPPCIRGFRCFGFVFVSSFINQQTLVAKVHVASLGHWRVSQGGWLLQNNLHAIGWMAAKRTGFRHFKQVA